MTNYYTKYNGYVTFSSVATYELFKYLIENRKLGSWKDTFEHGASNLLKVYIKTQLITKVDNSHMFRFNAIDDRMIELLSLILDIDENVKGIIECQGDSRSDIYELKLNGKLKRLDFNLIEGEGYEYKDTEKGEFLKRLMKDKKMIKEVNKRVMLRELEDVK